MLLSADSPELIYILFIAVWGMALSAAWRYARTARLVASQPTADGAAPRPPLSVVITVHNQADSLRRNLPLILEQEYDPFEVIVVDNDSTDDTESVLKALELKYEHLSHMSTPKSARYISPKRLSLTLGIRSARYDWVVLTEAGCHPDSPRWLEAVGACCGRSSSCQMVLGYANYVPQRSFFARKLLFFRLFNQLMLFAHCARHAAYRADASNLAYRKSFFLSRNGFAGHVNLLSGAEELLVNRNSTPQNTLLALHPDAYVRQELPSARRLWKQERVYYMETRRYFRHTWSYRLTYHLTTLLPWACLFCWGAALTVAFLRTDYVEAGLGIGLYLAYLVVKDVAFNRSARALGERGFHLLLPFLELAVPLWNLSARLAHLTHSRRDFRKKII